MSAAPASVHLRDAEQELSRQLELCKQPGDEPCALSFLQATAAEGLGERTVGTDDPAPDRVHDEIHIADNRRQQQLLNKLEVAVNARLSLLDRATALRQTQGIEAATSLIQSDKRQLGVAGVIVAAF